MYLFEMYDFAPALPAKSYEMACCDFRDDKKQ